MASSEQGKAKLEVLFKIQGVHQTRLVDFSVTLYVLVCMAAWILDIIRSVYTKTKRYMHKLKHN